jgi:hypothetical protein
MAAATAQDNAQAEHVMENEMQEKETAPIANGKSVRPSAHYIPPARPSEPIPNGKKMYGKKMRKNARANHAMKSRRSSNAEPIRNGKSNEKSVLHSTRHTPHSTTKQPSTVHRPPSATNADDKKIEGKKMKKMARTLRSQRLAQ